LAVSFLTGMPLSAKTKPSENFEETDVEEVLFLRSRSTAKGRAAIG
jgi:hypothetical protein